MIEIKRADPSLIRPMLSRILKSHADSLCLSDDSIELSCSIFDHANNQYLGGTCALVNYNILYIHLFAVHESIRSQGYGKRLIRNTESLGRSYGAELSWLHTYSFEGVGFYEKLGYDRVAVIGAQSCATSIHIYSREL